MKSDLELRYKGMADDGLLAIIHSASFRPDARRLARRLLLDRGLSEVIINQWRDPNAILAEPCCPHNPSPRVLFLRPFGLPDSGGMIRSFVRQHLSFIGYTYTLSDTEIKPWPETPHIFKVIMMVIGVPWLILWYPRPSFNVRYHEDIPRLINYMCRRFARSITWLFSNGFFKITCTQETWKRVVQYLINRVDLLVVDLSDGGEGLRWELEELLFYDAVVKTVFVTHEGSMRSAQLFLELCGLSKAGQRLFAYTNNGLATSPEELKAALTSVVFRQHHM
jgi:hypothetical protein